MKAYPLAVYLNGIAVDHRGDAGHVGKGWGGEQAEGDGESAHRRPRGWPYRHATALVCLTTPALADVAGVASVIDGDTIEVHGQRIRLHGIDAPESRQLCRQDRKPWQCGKDAANALARKIARRPVTCEDLGRDRYMRIISRCTVAGEDINAWMVSQGLALAYRRYSHDYNDEEADARAARRGIWAGKFVKPWEWRRGKRLDMVD